MKTKNKWIKVIIILFLLILVLIYNKENIMKLFSSIYSSFIRTVIDEKRYILFLSGLKSTLLISFFSIIIGTLFGFILFLLHRSKIKILKIISLVFVRFLQGVPVTVLLLTFYFGFFGSINIEPIIVAVIAFSIYFSAYVSEIIKGDDTKLLLQFLKIFRSDIDIQQELETRLKPKNEGPDVPGYIIQSQLTQLLDILNGIDRTNNIPKEYIIEDK